MQGRAGGFGLHRCRDAGSGYQPKTLRSNPRSRLLKTFLKASFAAGLAVASLSAKVNAQTVEVKALGSSGLFLELGLAADYSGTGGIGATCVWSESTKTVTASDTTLSPAATDTGNAWVAWTPQSGSCTTVNSSTKIYSYLQTDSVVGNRCLFNGSKCTIAYPTTDPAPANLILPTGEVSLPASIATALNKAAVNAAGTDIRPEDAEFAVARALKPCGTAVASGSQYLGLGYTSSSSDPIQSFFSTSKFNVVNFTLPSTFTVTPVGATPVLVVVNGDGSSSSFSNTSIKSISSKALAFFLDGTYSYSLQALSSPSASGNPATVLIREPLSGTYNTMEYNVPNTLTNKTSQDVGLNQPTAQKNCNGSVPKSNPMNIATPSGGARKRAIGTGEELKEVLANPNSLGYGFWSVANFASFTGSGAANAKYLEVDGIDPLLKSGITYTGVVPTTGTTELSQVDLHGLDSPTGYPIWSLLRLVNAGSTANPAVTSLATSAAKFVSFGSTTSRPDFITPTSLKVVRSHFIPPAGTIEPTKAANGHVGLTSSACTSPEAGGDVGGVVYLLTTDSSYCSTNHVTTGHTGQRR